MRNLSTEGERMSQGEFTGVFCARPQNFAWFLGAGASRTAGLPTATDIMWDMKRRYYCQEENQHISRQDIQNQAIKERIQSFMESRGFPPLWSDGEYCGCVQHRAVRSLLHLSKGRGCSRPGKQRSENMSIQTVPLSSLQPPAANPRSVFDTSALDGLVASIKADGLLHNLVVAPAKGKGRYRVVSGERRYRVLN
jgi:hypothetical protein